MGRLGLDTLLKKVLHNGKERRKKRQYERRFTMKYKQACCDYSTRHVEMLESGSLPTAALVLSIQTCRSGFCQPSR